MANVIFNGANTAQATAGETVTITVTKPDATVETLTATTLADRTYSITRPYTIAGTYKAKAHQDADEIYTSWDSAEQTFTIQFTARTGTLVVTLS